MIAIATLGYITHTTWMPWLHPENMKDNGDVIQTYGALFGVLATVISALIWMLKKQSNSASSTTSTQKESQTTLHKDTLFEATPASLDKCAEISPEKSPYVGLSAFKPADAHLFFGRHREIREALGFLGRPLLSHDGKHDVEICHWLQIEGNSGAGKSSLVNAGLLPFIEQNALSKQTPYQHWEIIESMMPGEKPLKRLAESLEKTFIQDPLKRNTLERQRQLEEDERYLAYFLGDQKGNNSRAFVLFVDQFEELFTFAEKEEKQQFDAQISNALQDEDCPLFLISTVRIDFLQGFEQLPKLSELYNRYCKRYLLKTISLEGLKEAITRPAEIAGLDVSDVTTPILIDAQNEVGALPLVENALQVLWQQRDLDLNKLSGDLYREKGQLIGLLEEQADLLLELLDKEVPNGKHSALELLLALTRINDEGAHTRRNLSMVDAALVAGGKKADTQQGKKIIAYLTGGDALNGMGSSIGRLRLLTTVGDEEQEQQVSIIHETLIRAREEKDETTGKRVGYWKTLYSYIDKNRDRNFYRDQLTRKADAWHQRRGIRRFFTLAGFRELKLYRDIRLEKGSPNERFITWSRRMAVFNVAVICMVLAFVGQSYLWTFNNSLPPSYMMMQQKFRLMDWGIIAKPYPEMVKITPKMPFIIGENDKEWGVMANESLQSRGEYNRNNFGFPNKKIEQLDDYSIGKYEITYEQYDYYVWQQRKQGHDIPYPGGEKSLEGQQRAHIAVTNVSWLEAVAYTEWLSGPKQTGDNYRLPTEVEWEYAARAGTETAYWWGEERTIEDKVLANCDGCGSVWDNKAVAPVGSFAANPFGLHDTAGNVWEWTCSEWKTEFDDSHSESHCVSAESGQRVLRGGSWLHTAVWLRSSVRSRSLTETRNNFVGFRVVIAARTN